ncbi:DUF2061 domain-containing protein [Robiginitalea sp. M366]|uniref:DUF2061 domain-containing protein n=1 Tax=Robiginitalea aestuariiviva TaxID=3036903 RepID=UPI00240E9A32|nr:DUF2061 domain-containing protein [Robiginitalea aestuariiviva]MDG1572711.1 DUF2061 domain-containing protein [Robiginitalea aestuariiviva]
MSIKRQLAKTVTWRLVGTLDTVLIAWLITADPFTGMQIGLAEVLTKMALYFLHERFWDRLPVQEGARQHLLKTVSWRLIGTLDTTLLAWAISGNPWVGMQIGLVEVLTKMALYYLHERAWYRWAPIESRRPSLEEYS